MSSIQLIIIPADPHWVPSRQAADAALQVLTDLVPAGGATRQWLDAPQFFAPAENWQDPRCPHCASPLGQAFTTAIHAALAPGGDLAGVSLTTPCCGRATPLNALDYAPCGAGIASFHLTAFDLRSFDLLPAEQLARIAAALGHPVRQILSHT